MRELCIEEIAMSTRVALPMFLGCRMSELRRHLVPSPTPSQDHSSQPAQVRRNLFGPIDHDENLKFVQNELTKISQADCKKWNFDFEAEKPQDGRFNWEPVVEGVPQAYEMPRLNCLSNCGGTTTTKPHTTIASPSSSTSSSISSSPSALSVPECSTTTTTTATPSSKTPAIATTASSSSTPDKPTFTKTSKPNLPSCSKDTKSSSEIVVVRPKQCNNNSSSLDSKDRREQQHKSLPSVKNVRTRSTQPPPRSTQPPVTAFMKIRKSKRAATTKLEDDQPPALVKRSKTTTS